MNITDELREWAARELASWKMARERFDALTAIADRIDAEHESACAEAYGSGVMSVPIALDESQWVRLPKDAGGEYIHAGDVLTDGEYTFRVDELAAFGDGSWSIRNEGGNAWAACDVTHHHAPTVEDVLREFAAKLCIRDGFTEATEETFAEYAAKLRLREDA